MNLSAKHKELEDELHFKTLLLDNCLESIFVHDLQGNVVYANKTAHKDRGYTREELTSMNLAELVLPPYNHLLPSYLQTLAKEGYCMSKSLHLKKDKTALPVEVQAKVFQFKDLKLAVSIARDITKEQKARELSEALNQINMAIHSTLEFKEIMERVIQQATKAIGCETGIVILREQKQWIISYAFGFPEEVIGLKLSEKQAEAMAFVAETKEPMAFNDACHDKRLDIEQMQAYQIRSVLIAPLIVRDKVIGCLSFQYRTKRVDFTRQQLDFASKLAATVSLAVENAQLYGAERKISQTLQEALLTMPETLPGLDFSYLYHSASNSTVGGDFYDLFELEHNRFGVIIGDISGKGLPAATLTSLVRNTIKAYAYEDSSPAATMTKTNKVVVKATAADTFATVLFGILDLNQNLFTYCTCGHPPAVLKKQRGKSFFLQSNSPAIGVLSGLNYINSEQKIDAEDVLVFYTDGVTEARFYDQFFGLERLVRFIDSFPSKSAKEIVPAIFNEVKTFTKGKFKDDIAILALRRA